MATPVAAFLAWYESLPEPHRQYLAGSAGLFNEEVDAAVLDDSIAAFTRRVTRSETEKLRAIALMIALRGWFEYLFSRDWEACHREWEETGRENSARSERKRSSEEDELVRRSVLEIDSRHARERATIETWRRL